MPSSSGADMGGLVCARVRLSVFVADGNVAIAPCEAVVVAGIGLLKALKKSAVPKVSVKAIPRT